METPPEFLRKHETIQSERTFLSGSTSRKGELIAWGSAVAVGLPLAIFYFTTREVQCLTAGLFIFFLCAAALITFGLWADSRTFALVTPEYLRYKSPFRTVNLTWDQVEEVRAADAGAVWRVVVIGANRYFRVRVLREEDPPESKRRFLVFPQADQFIRIICGMAKLRNPRKIEDEWVCTRS